jgi:hypothetical protein
MNPFRKLKTAFRRLIGVEHREDPLSPFEISLLKHEPCECCQCDTEPDDIE